MLGGNGQWENKTLWVNGGPESKEETHEKKKIKNANTTGRLERRGEAELV